MDGQKRFYLDYNASAPLLDAAREALVAACDLANPSSVHTEGRAARKVVEDARGQVAELVGASAENVILTSGATEAANLALTPSWERNGAPLSISGLAVLETDHPCTRLGGRFTPTSVTTLPVDQNGTLRLEALEQWAGALNGASGMLAISLANAESGVIQPMEAIRTCLAPHDVLLIVDAVQAAGRECLAMSGLGADAVILSGHKIGAAKGVGALIFPGEAVRPQALMRGGGQERGIRSGTQAVPAIASFGAAARVARSHAEDIQGLTRLRNRLEEGLQGIASDVTILGSGARRIANTVLVASPGLRAESAQMAFDLSGIAVSAGSACSSGKVGASVVVEALSRSGAPVDPALGAIRVSFGLETEDAAIERFLEVYGNLARRAQTRRAKVA